VNTSSIASRKVESLEPRTLFAGITLVTHGLESSFPQWVDRMAEAVARRIDPQGASTWANVSHYRMQVTNPSAPVVTTFTRTEGPAPSASSTGEIVISLDWVPVDSLSGPSTGTVAQAVANALLSAGASFGFGGELMELPIHLIGHSRGGSLITALAADLGARGAWVDQLSPLDPVPIGNDAAMNVTDNVAFADNYYETSYIVHGNAVAGAHNVGPLSLPGGSNDHSDVHTFYHGTIGRGDTSDGDTTINDAWYAGALNRATTGYDWSRISGAARPADGLAPIAGGIAARTHVATSGSDLFPDVGNLVLNASNVIHNGEPLSLSYRYQDVAGGGTLRFYLDDDTNPYNGNRRVLGTQTNLTSTGAAPSSLAGTFNTSWFGAGLLDGVYQIYAAVTSAGATSHTRYAWLSQAVFDGGGNLEPLSRRWSNDTHDNQWTNARNWSPGGAPTAIDRVALSGANASVVSGANLTSVSSLHLLNGASFALAASGNKLLSTTLLSIDNSSQLDLNDNDLLLDYTGSSPLVVLQTSINIARAAGAWTGNGLTSSAAKNNAAHNTTLGAMEASDFKNIYGPGATFDGQAIDTSAVLIKYTYYGDADFNGRVNFDDYVRTDNGFNNQLSGWVNGDFDGNGAVNFDDYVLIDLAFNTQSGTLRNAGVRGA
jgi:hypothetical protein